MDCHEFTQRQKKKDRLMRVSFIYHPSLWISSPLTLPSLSLSVSPFSLFSRLKRSPLASCHSFRLSSFCCFLWIPRLEMQSESMNKQTEKQREREREKRKRETRRERESLFRRSLDTLNHEHGLIDDTHQSKSSNRHSIFSSFSRFCFLFLSLSLRFSLLLLLSLPTGNHLRKSNSSDFVTKREREGSNSSG